MRVAICLYGQPRDYKTGFKYLKQFMELNPSVVFDFYFHTWKIPKDQLYETSPWTSYSTNVLKQDENIETSLIDLYKPVNCMFENKLIFIIQPYVNTIAYKNTFSVTKKQNIQNLLSQMHSRMKVCEMFSKTHIKYDYVITTRFDYCHPIHIDLSKIDTQKTYVSSMHVPRHILPDRFMMFPVEIYKSVFSNMYDTFDNAEINTRMVQHGELLEINPENVILAKFLQVCGSTQSVVFTDLLH